MVPIDDEMNSMGGPTSPEILRLGQGDKTTGPEHLRPGLRTRLKTLGPQHVWQQRRLAAAPRREAWAGAASGLHRVEAARASSQWPAAARGRRTGSSRPRACAGGGGVVPQSE
eukprot:COSAG01_NODE_27968_length_672_cov_1.521815_1_plen_113_part_00